MSRLPPLPPSALSEEARELIASGEPIMGFVPNDALDMARRPDILRGVTAMVAGVYGPGEVEPGLKRLVGYIASTAAGCVYCQQHTAHGSLKQGVEAEKLRAAWEYESSPLFTEAERAALRVAHLGSLSPSQVCDADVAALREHFTDGQVVEIVAVIAMFGFLNRWNAVMGTEIEPVPRAAFAGAGLELRREGLRR